MKCSFHGILQDADSKPSISGLGPLLHQEQHISMSQTTRATILMLDLKLKSYEGSDAGNGPKTE